MNPPTWFQRMSYGTLNVARRVFGRGVRLRWRIARVEAGPELIGHRTAVDVMSPSGLYVIGAAVWGRGPRAWREALSELRNEISITSGWMQAAGYVGLEKVAQGTGSANGDQAKSEAENGAVADTDS